MSETESPPAFSPVAVCARDLEPGNSPIFGEAASIEALGGRVVVRATVPGEGTVYALAGADADLAYDPAVRSRAGAARFQAIQAAQAEAAAAAAAGTPHRGAQLAMPPQFIHNHNLLNAEHRIIDPPGEMARIYERGGGDFSWHKMDTTTDADREIKRFQEQFPVVSGMLGIDDGVKGFDLFPIGQAFFSHNRTRPDQAWFAGLAWRAYLQRHRLGDFGEYGQHDPSPLTDPEVFALGFMPVNRQNDHAILNGTGLVRSRFRLDHPNAPKSPQPRIYTLRHYVEATTWVAGDRTKTYLQVVEERGAPDATPGRKDTDPPGDEARLGRPQENASGRREDARVDHEEPQGKRPGPDPGRRNAGSHPPRRT